MTAPIAISLNPAFAPYPVPQAACSHPIESQMVAGGFHPQKRRTDTPRPRGLFCMDCGRVLLGDMTPGACINALWAQYGWHMHIGKRLCHLSVRVARQIRLQKQAA